MKAFVRRITSPSCCLRDCVLFLLCFLASIAAITGAPVKRIVSLAPSLTRNLIDMGAEGDLVGCTSYCQTNHSKAIVASAVTVNVEKVIALKPDLVVTTALTNGQTLATLRKFRLNVVVYPKVCSFEDICSQFIDLGRRAGRSARAMAVIQQTRQQVDKLKGQQHKPLKLFFQIGSDPLFAVIPNTYMNDLIRFAGGRNIAADLKRGSITRETVLKRDPDVIFIATMGVVGVTEKKQWESIKALSAVKHKRVFLIDAYTACMPCPVCFVQTLQTMTRLIRQS
ncbi:MAG: helical backbone metal receptor [Bacteroidota bacterium]|nr:helical backbone metal receptor [Bacteroidota bacterium]